MWGHGLRQLAAGGPNQKINNCQLIFNRELKKSTSAVAGRQTTLENDQVLIIFIFLYQMRPGAISCRNQNLRESEDRISALPAINVFN